MNYNQGSKSSMNMSSDSQVLGVENHVTELNGNLMQVRRPNENQVLAFLEYEQLHLDQDLRQPLKTHPLSHRDSRSVASRKSDKLLMSENSHDKSDLSPLKQAQQSHQELLFIESPMVESPDTRRAHEMDSKKKIKTSISHQHSPSRSPKRRSKYFSKIFTKFTGKMQLINKFIHKLKNIRPYSTKLNNKVNQILQDLGSDCQILQPLKLNNTSQFLLSFKKKKKTFLSLKSATIQAKKVFRNYCSFEFIMFIIRLIQNHTINPQGNFLFFWEFCKFFITLMSLFQLSIQLCFNLNVLNWFFFPKNKESQLAFIVLFFYYFIDMILAFKTGYYKDGEVVTKQRRISKRYLHRFFIIDLISILPILINMIALNYMEEDTVTIKIFNCLSFVRSNAISRIYNSLEGRLLSHPRFVVGYRFLSVIGMVFLYAHVFGCLWYLVGSSYEDNWLVKAGIQDQPWYSLYSYSIYWSVMTMTTVGYGDITPQNYVEALFCVGTMFIASIIFAYSLNTIGLILNQMNANDQKINENMAIINRYMNRKNLNLNYQFRVRQYLSNLWNEELKFRIHDENKILNKLSDTLKEELQFNLYGKFMNNIPLFTKHISQECLLDITKQVSEIRITPNTYLFEQQTIGTQGLFMMMSGEAEIIIELHDRKINIGKMKKGDVLGQSSFFQDKLHPYSARALNTCSVAFLSKTLFLEILRKYPNDYFTYRMQIDICTFQNDHNCEIGLKCQICGSHEHDIDRCKQLHLILDKNTVIRRHLYSVDTNRARWKRNSRRTTNARFGQRLFEDAVSLYQENNFSFDSDLEQSQSQDELNLESSYNNKKVSPHERTSQSYNNKSHHTKSVRFRKRSHSLNSISLGSELSNYQKSMSGYKSYESKQSERISAIAPKNVNNPSSQLSQSSFNVFVKDTIQQKRKLSKQQESDRYSNHSNPRGQQQLLHKYSSQSSSGLIQQSNIGVHISQQQQNSPQLIDDKSFTKHEDSIYLAQDRRKKSLIGTNKSNILKVVNEVRDYHQEDSLFSREASLHSHSKSPRQQRTYGSDAKKRDQDHRSHDYRSHDTRIHENRTHDNRTHDNRTHDNRTHDNRTHDNRSHDNRTHDNRTVHYNRTETYRYHEHHSPQQFNEEFEQPSKSRAYFPQYNRDSVIEKLKNHQQRLTMLSLNQL